MPPDRCPTCDRVVASDAQADAPETEWDRSLCYANGSDDCNAMIDSGHPYAGTRVDWRKRAMELKREADAAVTKLSDVEDRCVAIGYARGIEDAAKRIESMRNNPVVAAPPAPNCIDVDDAAALIRALATKRSNDGNG